MPVFEYECYRTFLKDIIAKKSKKNPRFSLRAMANHLEVAPSYLSMVLKGSKSFSLETAARVGAKLKLNEDELEYFCLLTQKDSVHNIKFKEILNKKIADKSNPLPETHRLKKDHFRMISDWYHFAILACTELNDFMATPQNLAEALGISETEVLSSLERMERLGLIRKNEDGHYQEVESHQRVESASADQALRQFHRQTLEKAITSLETQSPQQKIIGSETFAIDSSLLGEFRDLTEAFFNKAIALANKSKKRDRVYHLGVQFFDFTDHLNKKRKGK